MELGLIHKIWEGNKYLAVYLITLVLLMIFVSWHAERASRLSLQESVRESSLWNWYGEKRTRQINFNNWIEYVSEGKEASAVCKQITSETPRLISRFCAESKRLRDEKKQAKSCKHGEGYARLKICALETRENFEKSLKNRENLSTSRLLLILALIFGTFSFMKKEDGKKDKQKIYKKAILISLFFLVSSAFITPWGHVLKDTKKSFDNRVSEQQKK